MASAGFGRGFPLRNAIISIIFKEGCSYSGLPGEDCVEFLETYDSIDSN